jgi:hypothetical protein
MHRDQMISAFQIFEVSLLKKLKFIKYYYRFVFMSFFLLSSMSVRVVSGVFRAWPNFFPATWARW